MASLPFGPHDRAIQTSSVNGKLPQRDRGIAATRFQHRDQENAIDCGGREVAMTSYPSRPDDRRAAAVEAARAAAPSESCPVASRQIATGSGKPDRSVTKRCVPIACARG